MEAFWKRKSHFSRRTSWKEWNCFLDIQKQEIVAYFLIPLSKRIMKVGTFYGATAAKRTGIMQLKLPNQTDMYQAMQRLLSSSVQNCTKAFEISESNGFFLRNHNQYNGNSTKFKCILCISIRNTAHIPFASAENSNIET